jgi:hypothetical protein
LDRKLGKDAISIAWNILHDLCLGSKALDLVCKKSAELCTLSSTMDTWRKGPYGVLIRFMNVETLSACRKIWTNYKDFSSSPDNYPKVIAQVHQICSKYEVHWRMPTDGSLPKVHLPSLTASFGTSINKADVVTLYHMNQYWSLGVTDKNDLPDRRFVSPLFVYTRIAHDKFILEPDTTPLTIFHLRGAGEKCERWTVSMDRNNLEKVVAYAKGQFRAWCETFRDFVESSAGEGKLVMRFAAADPITFCVALQKSLPNSIFKNFTGLSSTWSGTPIVINDKDRITQFNTIDTTTLIDEVGCINILLATVPLLRPGPATTLTTQSYRQPWNEETTLLTNYLCGHPVFMYHVFGIAPLSYVTCTSPIGHLQDTVALMWTLGEGASSVISQIVWKFPWGGDSNVTKPTKVYVHGPELQNIISEILMQMHGNLRAVILEELVSPEYFAKVHRRRYNPASFAALLAFAKRRIDCDWDGVMRNLYLSLESNFDLQLQLHLFEVFTFPEFVAKMLGDAARVRSGHWSYENPLELKSVVLTVPAPNVRGMYNTLRQSSGKYNLEIRYMGPRPLHNEASIMNLIDPAYRDHWVGCILPILGDLAINEDGKTGRIESQVAQWGGHFNDEREDSPDLHLVFYLPESLVSQLTDRKGPDCIIRLGWTEERHSVADLGDGLRAGYDDFGTGVNDFEIKSIFKTTFSDAQHVHFLESIEGFEPPLLTNADKPPPASTGRSDANRPPLLPLLSLNDGKPAYWVHMQFTDDDIQCRPCYGGRRIHLRRFRRVRINVIRASISIPHYGQSFNSSTQ